MAIFKLTLAPVLRVSSACARVHCGARLASGVASAGGAASPPAVPPPVKDVGYTITEVAVEKLGKSSRKHALAMVEYVKGHSKKVNPLARQVAGKSVAEALAQMAFSPARRAPQVTRAINRAVNKARGPSGLPTSAFKVVQAWTGKHTASQRIRHHSKGRAGKGSKRTSKLWVKVTAMNPTEAGKLNRFTSRPTPDTIAALDPRAY